MLIPLTMLVIAGCGSTTESTASTVPVSTVPVSTVRDSSPPDTVTPTVTPTTGPTTLPAEEVDAAMYFVRAEHLTVVGRNVSSWDGVSVMEALLAGPTAAEEASGVTSMIPAGTKVLGVDVQGSEATVDLDARFESGGGSLSMNLRVAEVVYTLTQLPHVDTVRFRIDGEQRDMIGGEGIMVDGVGRADFADSALPGILLENPFDGSPLAQPISIGGMTNTFEATVNYQVLAPDGTVLVEGITTATCGTGCWGNFFQELPMLPAGTTGPVTLRVFDYSEADGTTMLDVVEITLT
jgi:spore germination protein GerM